MKTLILAVLIALPAVAHEGHDTPGVLPIPPNGGKLGEATHKGAHKHKGPEKELFFEVVYKKKELRIFPHVLGGKEHDTFVPVSPKKELKKLKVSVELPRQKKVHTLKTTVDDKGVITAKFDPKRAYRFYVHVSATHDKEMKTAKIQIEKK